MESIDLNYVQFRFINQLFNQAYVLINFWIFLRFFSFKEKFRSKRNLIIFGTYFFCVLVGITREQTEIRMNPLCMVLFSVLLLGVLAAELFFLLDGKITGKIFLYFSIKMLEIVSSIVANKIFYAVFGGDAPYLISKRIAEVPDMTIPHYIWVAIYSYMGQVIAGNIALFFTAFVFVKTVKFLVRFENKIPLYLSLVLIPLSQILLFTMIKMRSDDVGFTETVLVLTVLLIGGFGDIFLIYEVNQSNKKSEIEKQLLVDEKMQQYYSLIENQKEKIAEMQADIDAHVEEARTMIGEGDSSAAYDSLTKISERKRFVRLNYCDNPAVNAIMVDIKSKCEKYNIKTDFIMMLGEKCGVDDFDMVSVISNVMDNAIEANLNVPEEDRKIFVRAEDNKGVFVLMCENSFTNGSKKIRMKSDKMSFGNGTEIIKKITKKYGGTYKTEASEKLFKTSILLYE